MATVSGICDERFASVKALLLKQLNGPDELGASITVNIDGKNVVDIWGGYKDEAKQEPWDENTIVNVYSSTKTLINLAMLILIDRGLVDPNEPVATYWPEFAANGKEKVLVRHLMSHTSGLSGWEEPITTDTLFDFDKSAALLAAQAPWWEPGTQSGYQSLTMGYLLGMIVRRVTGQTMREFVDKEIAQPLGADFQIGAKEADWPRVTNIIPPYIDPNATLGHVQPPPLAAKTFFSPPPEPLRHNEAGWRLAEIGAANGHSNSRGMNRALSVIALGGEVDGKRLLSQGTIDRIFEQQSSGPDLAIGVDIRFGIGYALTGAPATASLLPDGKICFWCGWGGSMVIMDLERRMTITYAMNKLKEGIIGNSIANAYIREVYKCVGVEVKE